MDKNYELKISFGICVFTVQIIILEQVFFVIFRIRFNDHVEYKER